MSILVYTFLSCIALDGDTIRCDNNERVRLVRIDAPELHSRVQADRAYDAKEYLASLIDGSKVYCVVKEKDKYGRLLGECMTNESRSLSNSMLESGLADVYRGRP